MSVESLLVIFVAIAAFGLLLQCLSIWNAAKAMRRAMEGLDRRSAQLETEVQRLMDQLQGIAQGLEPIGNVARNVSTNLELLSEKVKLRALDLDEFVKEMTKTGRDQASKIDFVVTDTVQKFEQTTDLIQKDVLKPAVELSAFIKGVKSGLEYLFQKKPPRPTDSHREEEELFI